MASDEYRSLDCIVMHIPFVDGKRREEEKTE